MTLWLFDQINKSKCQTFIQVIGCKHQIPHLIYLQNKRGIMGKIFIRGASRIEGKWGRSSPQRQWRPEDGSRDLKHWNQGLEALFHLSLQLSDPDAGKDWGHEKKGWPFPCPRDFPIPGIKPGSPALQAVSSISGRFWWFSLTSLCWMHELSLTFMFLPIMPHYKTFTS